ncbi:DUF3558 domain-containing protein [Amycolatopsis palatopharyngis]|uniref:DUF3558 domain-containing protein n=1 Tax=Amycolatopsis palatopharyngis TaxID=187982 RepID=UPI0013BEA83E|nr:DUF3558 domain-containing protein [Amycolatopsis palatopharyngis]
MPRWKTTVGVAFLAAVAAGCSGEEPGTPNPVTPDAGPGTSTSDGNGDSLPRHGAPKVENPLDTSYFRQQDPCAAITDAEMTEFFGDGVTTKPRPDGAAGPACTWNAAGIGQASIGVIFPTVDQSGLSGIYSNRDEAAFFIELPPITGYPAVAYDLGDQRPEGRCNLDVGTSDTQTVNVSIALSEDKIGKIDPCEAVHEVASTVIANIKERN